jgi:hypothetical protein
MGVLSKMAGWLPYENESMEFVNRLEEHKRIREGWDDLWQDISDYVLPRRSVWEDTGQKGDEGQKTGTTIYDGYPRSTMQTMADGMQGYLISPAVEWFKLRMEQDEANDAVGVADWLEACEQVLYAIFHRANFYDAAGEFLLDGVGIGTATMIVEKDPTMFGVRFDTVHPKEIYIAENYTAKVDTWYRNYWRSARAAYQQFGDQLPDHIIETMEHDPEERFEFLHVIHPRSERIEGVETNTNLPNASVHVCMDTGTLLRSGGYNESPYLTWRFRKNTDETYGRSPAADCISDIKRANQIARTQMKMAQLAVEPPLNIPQDMKGQERIVPMGYNYYTQTSGKIEPVQFGSQYPLGLEVLDRIHKTIDDHFYTEFFMMLARAERQMTAREIIERQGEKSAVLGAVVGRLNSEFLSPLIERTFNIAMRSGWLPQPPPTLQGGRVDVEFIGPLAQAQRRYSQTQGINASLGSIMSMAQIFGPTVLDNFDSDEIARKLATAEGMPQKGIREEPDMQEIRAQRAQQIAAQQQMEMLGQTADIRDKMTEPAAPGSPAENIDRQLQAGQNHGRPFPTDE